MGRDGGYLAGPTTHGKGKTQVNSRGRTEMQKNGLGHINDGDLGATNLVQNAMIAGGTLDGVLPGQLMAVPTSLAGVGQAER